MKTLRAIIISLLAITITACSSTKREMAYFVDIDTLSEVPVGEYLVKIEPADELLITVTSKLPSATKDYNLLYVNPVAHDQVSRQTAQEQQTYTVDSKGNIDFPVLGTIHVQGMTIEELKDYLTQRISADVEDPLVTVNLLKFTINVAGEVVRPGAQRVTAQRYSILDALAVAGDLTQYGRRDNVLLIREEDGKRIHVRLDLNSAETLRSPYYFLKQNDYIYVEPNDIRRDNAEYSQYNSYKLSVVSTIVSASASIISLIIAFAR